MWRVICFVRKCSETEVLQIKQIEEHTILLIHETKNAVKVSWLEQISIIKQRKQIWSWRVGDYWKSVIWNKNEAVQ